MEMVVEIRVLARQACRSRGSLGSCECRGTRCAGICARTASPGTDDDPFKDYLLQRVEAAKPNWIPAAVLYREIVERGYTGGLTQLKAFLAGHKPQPAADPLVRFETLPGERMQVDYVVFRRGIDRLSAFVTTLGYSRASYVYFVSDERVGTVIE